MLGFNVIRHEERNLFHETRKTFLISKVPSFICMIGYEIKKNKKTCVCRKDISIIANP